MAGQPVTTPATLMTAQPYAAHVMHQQGAA